jgi:hypothetical protein
MLDITLAAMVTGARLGAGRRVVSESRRPPLPIEFYEFEACPYCRKVREALSALDLDVLVYPCPRGGTRFRSRVKGLPRRDPRWRRAAGGSATGIVHAAQLVFGLVRALLSRILGSAV